jgi:hypothetical protein
MTSLHTFFFSIKQYTNALKILIAFITEVYVGCVHYFERHATVLPVSGIGIVI